MEKLQTKPNEIIKKEAPNESQKLLPLFREVQEERLTLDGVEVITVLKFIGTARSDND